MQITPEQYIGCVCSKCPCHLFALVTGAVEYAVGEFSKSRCRACTCTCWFGGWTMQDPAVAVDRPVVSCLVWYPHKADF